MPAGFPITSYSWFISSDGEYVNGTDSTSVNPQYLFYECGIHLVELTASDSLGCSHTYIDTVTIYQLPVANFYTDDICDGDSTCIYDLSESTLLISWEIKLLEVRSNIKASNLIRSLVL